MWDVLEHIHNPIRTIKEIKRILTNQGVLIIETLNCDSIPAKVLKNKWPLFSPPYHINYFSIKGIKYLLKNSGFKPIKILPIQTYLNVFNKYFCLIALQIYTSLLRFETIC